MRTRFDVSAERGLTPFVGRERELELLVDGFERARADVQSESGLTYSRASSEVCSPEGSIRVSRGTLRIITLDCPIERGE